MAEESVARVIEFLADALHQSGLRISRLVLFGSHARGTAHPDSDIDLAVVSEDFSGKDIFDRARAVKEAELATMRRFMLPLDIIMLTPDEYESGLWSAALTAGEAEAIYRT